MMYSEIPIFAVFAVLTQTAPTKVEPVGIGPGQFEVHVFKKFAVLRFGLTRKSWSRSLSVQIVMHP